MSGRYEERHRELREAEEATKGRSLGLSAEHVAAFEVLSKFDERTGPLVEELVAAVREVELDLDNYGFAGIRTALIALDEAAGRD